MKPRRKWYLLGGLSIGTMLGGLLAPACGPECAAKWILSGSAVGLLLGLIWDVMKPQQNNS